MAAVYLRRARAKVRVGMGVEAGIGVGVEAGIGVGVGVGVRVGVSDGCGAQPRVPRHAALVHLVKEIAHLRDVAKGGG